MSDRDVTRVTPSPPDTAGATTAPPSGAVAGDATQTQVPSPAFAPSELLTVPGYVVSRKIGRGGMGVVYAARDPAFDRDVAIKVMHAGQDAERFVVEAKVTAQLPHPGVPPVYAIGTLPDGRPFLAMKLIEGQTLADELKANDLPRFLGTFEHICLTVGFAHSRGIIHRDLKPANIMVGAFGEVLVMDWGLAREARGAEHGTRSEESNSTPERSSAPPSALRAPRSEETQAGTVKGTPAFMAPEQARGEPVDARADVFALGGILAVVLTGKPPFKGDTVKDTVRKAARGELGACFEKLDTCGADAELIALAKRCLAPDPADRYANGQEVAGAVAAYRTGVEERLRRAERDRAVSAAEAREQRKRRRVQLALAAAVLLLALGGGAVAWWQDRQQTERKIERERNESKRNAELAQAEADRRAAAAQFEGERKADARNRLQQARAGATAALALATDLRKQYKFKEAEAALAQAAELAQNGPPELLAEVKQARTDLAFVVRLDDTRYRKWAWVGRGTKAGFNTKIAPPEYRQAFAGYGLDLASLAPAEAAHLIAASPLKAELVAAVDDWALYEPLPTLRDRLLEVARRADPDPWRDRLRDPAVRASWVALALLGPDADPVRTPPAALGVLTEMMRDAGQDPTAVLTLARAAHPSDFELAFTLGKWYQTRDKNELAIGPYEAARALRPENASVWNNLGNALGARGDLVGAVAALREAVKRDPKNALAYDNLGLWLRDAGDHNGAIAAHKTAIAIDPKLATAHNNLGSVLAATKGDHDGAVAAHKTAIELDPDFAAAYTNLGNALTAKGDFVAAVAALKRATQLDPQTALYHFNLGQTLKAKGDHKAAVVAFKEAIRLDPKDAAAFTGLGNSLFPLEDIDGAAAAFAEAVRLNPKDAQAHNNLGVICGLRGKSKEAIAHARTAIAADPKYAMAHALLGDLLRRTGDIPGARAAFEEAVRLDARFKPLLDELPPVPVAPAPRAVKP